MTHLTKVHEILEENEFQLVSFGLAPNPTGFCFEIISDNHSHDRMIELDEALESLTESEENELREEYL